MLVYFFFLITPQSIFVIWNDVTYNLFLKQTDI